ncbi:MAG: acetyltransferase, partial [Pirellulales bacterium]|nr:acetyltransferase [Pirellulales bacterium]
MAKQVLLVGAGGHAKVLISLLRDLGFQVVAAYDDDEAAWGTSILDVSVTGPIDRLSDQRQIPALIAIGNNTVRQTISSRFEIEWLTVVHPRAHVDSSAELGAGTVVMAGAVVQPLAQLGQHVIVNTGASVDHDCLLGDFVHVAPGARVTGYGQLGNGVLLGTGAVAIPGIQIGEWTTVGAGAA